LHCARHGAADGKSDDGTLVITEIRRFASEQVNAVMEGAPSCIIQPVHADQGVREASRMNALKDSNADLPAAKMTDFRRHDKAAEYRQPAAFPPQTHARVGALPQRAAPDDETAMP
jgi:hypothetical protein